MLAGEEANGHFSSNILTTCPHHLPSPPVLATCCLHLSYTLVLAT